MNITLIAAVSDNGVIGAAGKLPWRLKADMRHFAETTGGHPVIMGRKTFVSMKSRPLSRRKNIVLTHAPYPVMHAIKKTGAVAVANPFDALLEAAGAEEVFVIGGGEIYQLFMPLASRIILTRVHTDSEGDIRFPEIKTVDWDDEPVHQQRHVFSDKDNQHDFTIVNKLRRHRSVVPV